MPCSFIGPSSLYQRWNLQLRFSYGFLKGYYDAMKNNVPTSGLNTDVRMQVLLVVRKGHSADGSSGAMSRVIQNLNEVVAALKTIPHIHFLHEDLGSLTFEEQLRLIGDSSVVVGMHGAGVTHSMHMSIGTRYCCGVIEMFPLGEYMPIRGHGNMARRMGHHYARLDLVNSSSSATGTPVPPEELRSLVVSIVGKIRHRATCIMPSVLSDPFLST